jgi:hypothetical protein
LIDN